jgi:competence protein ComEA
MKTFVALAFALLAPAAFAAVNVNTAGVEELQQLRTIDPARAQAIVDYRAHHGPFHSLKDLDKVPGIGKSSLLAIRKEVTFSAPDTGLPPAKVDNREADQADARVQRGYSH